MLLGNKKGSTQLLFATLVTLLVLSSFGTWGVLRHWRKLVELQLKLDRCVGETALEFRDHLNALDRSNEKIRQVRFLVSAAQVEPWLIPPLEASLMALIGLQEYHLARWQISRGLWISHLKCLSKGDHAKPLPAIDVLRLPPDHLGPQPLTWKNPETSHFQFEIVHSPRTTRATVKREANDPSQPKKKWTAHWGGFKS